MLQNPRVIYTSGLVIRLALFGFSSVIDTLSQRVELATPVTSFKRLTEGVFLYNNNIPPYDGGVFHQSPLLLCLFSFITVHETYVVPIIYTALDLSIAYALSLITELKQKKPGPSLKGETFISPNTVAALYLFNPLSIVSCASRSTLLFTNLSVILALLSIQKGRIKGAMFWAAMAVCLSFYPAMLLPGFLIFTKKKIFSFSIFLGFFGFLFAISRLVVGSWDFVESTYGSIIFLSDLTPNVGLFWYFFIELFDQFRSFFMLVFQFHVFIFTLPVCIKFRHQPLFAVAVLCGIMSIFKSYPSISDTTLFLGLLSIHYEIVPYCRQKFLIFNLFAYGTVLSPIFWHLWIYAGSGNANFFYAITLVYNFAQIFLLIECVYGSLRREFDIQHPEAIGKPVIQK